MIGATIETGQRNMAVLERAVIKDNTLLPGEWYGGQLHLQPLASDAGEKTCGGYVGSQGHEYQDAKQYARWGIDPEGELRKTAAPVA